MKIVIMDDILMNDEHIEKLKNIGTLQIYSGIPANKYEIINRAKDADTIVMGWTKLTGEVMDELPNLKYISLWATGYDYVDIEEATKRGIVVTNVPGYAKNAVAELAVSLMLAVMRKIPQADYDVRRTKVYNWGMFNGMELTGKTLGILGTGAIGCRVAQIAHGFDMKIAAYDPYPREDMVKKYNIKYMSFEEIFNESDIVTLHMPLMSSTAKIIGAKEFNMMKRSTIFINTARAELVNQEELYEALKNKKIYGAGLDDVDLSRQSGMDILNLDNVVVTPHMGFNTKEATITKTDICINNVLNYINSQPTNVVNPECLNKH